jgi:hypothetical protein
LANYWQILGELGGVRGRELTQVSDFVFGWDAPASPGCDLRIANRRAVMMKEKIWVPDPSIGNVLLAKHTMALDYGKPIAPLVIAVSSPRTPCIFAPVKFALVRLAFEKSASIN